MSEDDRQRLVGQAGLGAGELDAIRGLAEICNRHEGLTLKLNWGLLRARPPGRTNDFLCYRDGALIGHAALDECGSDFELTGMVHPAYRRRGIGSSLLAVATAECRRRGVSRLLLVCEHASSSGGAFVAAHGARLRYASSEYHLELDATPGSPPPPSDPLRLRQATSSDVDLLARIRARCFDLPEDESRRRIARDLDESGSRLYVADLAGEPIGSIGTVVEDAGVYIRGVGVLPAHQGRGHGRRLLAAAIAATIAAGHTHLSLDVATRNCNALSLYQSCGFRETNRYAYYDVDLRAPVGAADPSTLVR
jgi:ribosomal protein S18 acetylase RimI-like enzyme